MSKAHGIKFFALAAIVIVAFVVMFAGIHTFAAAEAGPQIGYEIDGSGWSAEKDVTITVDSAIELNSVTINGSDASSYLVSGDNYSCEYLYTADESANIVIVATDVNTDSNTVTIYAGELFIDTANPEFTAEVTGTANAWTSQDVLITFTQTGSVASGYTYYQSKDGGVSAEISGDSITYTASSSNGEYAYKAISGAGLEYSLPATYDVMIDKTSPVAPTTDLTTAYYTSQTVIFDVLFTSDGLSGETIYYTIDGSRPNSGSSTLVVGENSVNFGSDGTKTLRLIAIDAVGHESSVRSYLVKIDSTDYTVSFSSDPALGGTLEGDGTYKRGDTVTLSATPNAGYEFLSITEGGVIVSYDSEFLFEIDSDRTFVANFRTLIEIDYTQSEFTYDGNPKAIDSYLNYDPTGDYSGITTITYNGST